MKQSINQWDKFKKKKKKSPNMKVIAQFQDNLSTENDLSQGKSR